jgi:tRNA modification GTPase
MDNSTIAAIATPAGQGGIGIIKLSGPSAIPIATTIFSPSDSNLKTNTSQVSSADNVAWCNFRSHHLYLGHIIDPENRRIIDEVLLCIMKSPRSYTKEDVVEINAHGGPIALNSILDLVIRKGGRLAEPGEFTKRAFLNGRIDLTQAEAVIDVINARTDKSLQLATSQINGQLKRSVEEIRTFFLDILTRIEASIDFPDDVADIFDSKGTAREMMTYAIEPLKSLIQFHQDGNCLREGLKVAVVGRPNVGKSSLLNRLLQKDRAIVTSLPGTTRDTIEEALDIRGFPIILADTAGLHDTSDPIETLGIEKTVKSIEDADMIIFMVEAHRPLTAEDHKIFSRIHSKPLILTVNKIDLVNGEESDIIPESWEANDFVEISALYDRGIDVLKEKMIAIGFGKDPIDIDTVIIPNLRQKLLLEDCLRSAETINRELVKGTPMEIVAIDLQEAIQFLGQILGTDLKVDVLNQIFNRFCIGK